MELNIPQKPCLVQTERGFSVSYNGRFLYSKYAPSRAIEGAVQNLSILPGTLILALSPALWLGLSELLSKLSEDCFILGIECDKFLHDFAKEQFEKIKEDFKDKSGAERVSRVALLPFEENEYIVNILSGEKTVDSLPLPHISYFRRSIPIEMSAGTQFCKEEYQKLATLSQNTIASFWKNRITLTKLGRLYSRNLFRNIANLPNSFDLRNLIHKIDRPVFVFGAGESIEETIANVPKEKLEKCFVVAVDAALPALKSHGITPDAAVAVEGQLAIEKAYIGGGAKKSLLIADMTSRLQVTRHTDYKLSYFASKYTDASFFKELIKKDFFPPAIPPLGSVGLTATYIALILRKDINVPVFVSGLDFSFSLGRTHTKNAPAHIARLASANRLNPPENYAAAFKTGAKKGFGKNGIEIFTDAALEGYAKSFADAFTGTPNLYDAGKQGIPLALQELPSEKLSAYLDTVNEKSKPEAFTSLKETRQSLKTFLETEENALNRIKELLMFGSDVASCSMSLDEELKTLIEPREYLYLHFPDGYKCKTSDLSFLKRVRGQIDFFLKDIKQGLATLPFL